MPLRIAVVGSREYRDEQKIRRFIRTLPAGCEIVSGGCGGPDTYAVEEARAAGLETNEHFPNRKHFKNRAYHERNKLVARDCDVMVAFWDGTSGGTADAIRAAYQADKPVVRVGEYDEAPSYDDLTRAVESKLAGS